MAFAYSDESRRLQDRFDTRRLADRVADLQVHHQFTEREKTFIESRDMFFLATVDEHGQPTCSYRGGDPGFVRVLDDTTLAFPNYDGNGMYLSTGNVAATGRVGILFVDFERPKRIRVHGTAVVHDEPAWLERFRGAELVVEVGIGRAFSNCPRYLHNLAGGELSPHAPRDGHEVPEPEWKSLPEWAEVLPER